MVTSRKRPWKSSNLTVYLYSQMSIPKEPFKKITITWKVHLLPILQPTLTLLTSVHPHPGNHVLQWYLRSFLNYERKPMHENLAFFQSSPNYHRGTVTVLIPGTLQSSNMSSPVGEPLMPSLSSFWPVLKPSKPLSMRKAETPCWGLAVVMSVLAYTYTYHSVSVLIQPHTYYSIHHFGIHITM